MKSFSSGVLTFTVGPNARINDRQVRGKGGGGRGAEMGGGAGQLQPVVGVYAVSLIACDAAAESPPEKSFCVRDKNEVKSIEYECLLGIQLGGA